MAWLVTVPLLFMKTVFVMKLEGYEAPDKCMTLGASAALMIIWGYPAELVVEGDSGQRWFYWSWPCCLSCASSTRAVGGSRR